MTVTWVDWSSGAPGAPYDRPSPNLQALQRYLINTYGGSGLGIYVVRVKTGGTTWSSHAFGAALDWGYASRADALAAIDFLIVNFELLGVQMIVDEGYDRTWKCWRDELGGPGWKPGKVVGGGNWLHIETTPLWWGDAQPIVERLNTKDEVDMLSIDWKPGTPEWTAFMTSGCHIAWTFDGNADRVMRSAGVARTTVNDAELLGLIKSMQATTSPPPTLTQAMFAEWHQ